MWMSASGQPADLRMVATASAAVVVLPVESAVLMAMRRSKMERAVVRQMVGDWLSAAWRAGRRGLLRWRGWRKQPGAWS